MRLKTRARVVRTLCVVGVVLALVVTVYDESSDSTARRRPPSILCNALCALASSARTVIPRASKNVGTQTGTSSSSSSIVASTDADARDASARTTTTTHSVRTTRARVLRRMRSRARACADEIGRQWSSQWSSQSTVVVDKLDWTVGFETVFPYSPRVDASGTFSVETTYTCTVMI